MVSREASISPCNGRVTVVVADDDEDDRLLTAEAFKGHCGCVDMKLVQDGVELLDYLHGGRCSPWNSLTGLKDAKDGGIEALEKIKSDRDLENIPNRNPHYHRGRRPLHSSP